MAISSKGETATFKPPSNIEDGARGSAFGVCRWSYLPVKRKGELTAIIAESQRPRLSFLVEASGWACHCDGRCPSAARALLISNHIDEKEFTTAIFWGKQRNIALLGSSTNEGNLSSGPQ